MTKRLRNRLILSVAAVLGVVTVGPVLAVQYLDWNPHRERVAGWLSAALKRNVSISGALDLQLWPTAHIKVAGLRVESPDDAFKAPLLDLKSASIEVTLGALISKTILIERLEVDNAALSLQSLPDGRNNWTFSDPKQPKQHQPSAWTTIVRVAAMRDSEFGFAGRNPRFDQRLEIDELSSSLPEGRAQSAFIVRGRYNETPLSVNGSLALSDDDDVDAALAVNLGAASGTVIGPIRDVMDGGNANLALRFETTDLTETVGTVIPGLTPRARQMLAGTGSVTAEVNGWLPEGIRLEKVDVMTNSALLQVTASGEVELWRPGQVGLLPASNLRVLLETQALSELTDLFGGQLPLDTTAQAQGVLSGAPRNFRLDEIVFEASGAILKVSGTGRMEHIGSKEGLWLDLETKAETSSLARFTDAYGLIVPIDGSASASARVWGGRGQVRVDDIDAEVIAQSASLRAGGSIGPLGPSAEFDLPFEGATTSLKALLGGFAVTLPGDLSGTVGGSLKGTRNDLHVRDLDIDLRSDLLSASLTGSVGPLGPQASVNMPFRADLKDVAALAAHFGRPLAFSGTGSAQGILTGPFDDLFVTGLSAGMKSELGQIRLDGELGLAGDSPNLNIASEVTIPTLAALQPFTNVALSDYSGVSLTVSSEFFRAQGKVGLRHLSGVLRGDGIRQGRISGKLPDVSNLRSGSLAVDLELDHLGRLGSSFGFKDGISVPGKLSATVVGSKNPEEPFFVSVDGVTDGMSLKVSGRLADLNGTSDLDLTARFSVEDATLFGKLIDYEIPIEGPLSAALSIRRQDSSDANRLLQTNLAIEAEDIKATFAGDIAWPISSGTKLQAHIETASLKNLRRWLPGDLLDPGPVSLDGNLEFLESGAQQAEFSLLVGNNDLAGSVMLGAGLLPGIKTSAQGPGPLKVVGDVWSSRLNLMEIFPAPPSGEVSDAKSAETETQGSIFSNQPFSLDWVAPLAVDLDFQSKELVTRRFKANNLITEIDINDGVLTLRSGAGEFSGGSFDLDLKLDSTEKPYLINLDFAIEGLVAREIPALANSRLPLEGSVDVDIQITSRGISLKEWASKANGEFKVSGLNTYFPATGMDILTQSILAQILGVVNPKKKNEFHIVDCGIVGFRVVDGIVMSRDTIAIQTEEVTFLIRGGISLIDESIVLLIRPKARKGAGISASSFTNFYRVGGTLSAPKIEADLEGVLKTGATWGLAALTFGGSLIVQGLFDRMEGNKDVCAIATDNYSALLEEEGAQLVRTWECLRGNKVLCNLSKEN